MTSDRFLATQVLGHRRISRRVHLRLVHPTRLLRFATVVLVLLIGVLGPSAR